MHVDCWIQQVTTRVGAVTCWIQQSVSPKQVVGFSCLFNSEVDQFISKVILPDTEGFEIFKCGGNDFSRVSKVSAMIREEGREREVCVS